MAVDKVYADRDGSRLRAGTTIELYSNPCDGFGLLGLAVGDEVVISTAALEAADGPATWNTALWRVDGNRLALVAPGAVEVPNTATEPTRNSTMRVWAVILAGIAAFVLAAIKFGVGRRLPPGRTVRSDGFGLGPTAVGRVEGQPLGE